MADEETTSSGAVPGLVSDFLTQLRASTERLESLVGLRGRLPAPPSGMPLPGALSAAQLTSIHDAIVAQRRSIEALQAQLSAFDEQLAVMEQMLGPLAEWSKNWAEMEQRLLNLGRWPTSGGSP
ncbi:MAG: hypothetical protein ACRDOB_22460 [Streptosporangiaceae bacterium]